MTGESPTSAQTAASAASSADSRPLPRWRERPERVAWGVILASFAILLLLIVGVPLVLRTLYQSAAVEQALRFETTVGAVFYYPPRSEQPIALTDGRSGIGEGSRLETTDAATQGFLGLPVNNQSEDLLGTILVYPSTSLEVLRSRRPYFAGSNQPYTVRLRLRHGRVRVFTGRTERRPVEVQVETPHGEARLGEGSYSLSVSPANTEIAVRRGAARLYDGGRLVAEIEPNLRTWMHSDGTTRAPVPIEHNLLRDGSFDSPLEEVWESYTPPHITPGTVDVREHDGRQVARFFYQGPDRVHTEVGIRQEVEKSVLGYDSLKVKLDVKLIWQTLEGAGEQSSEFPVRFEMTYTDIYGKVERWGHGFYNMDPRPEFPLRGGEKIELFSWHSYESENLLELLEATRPARVNSIRLYASGWNYEAFVSDVGLIVE